MKKTIFFKTFWPNLAIIVTVLVVSFFIAGQIFENWYQHYLTEEMTRVVSLSRPVISTALEDLPRLQEQLNRLGGETKIRFTIIDAEGTVLGDSDKAATDMENHRDRPEIAAALRGELGSNLRFSTTEMARMFYLAVPMRSGNEETVILRVSIFARDIDVLIARFRFHLQIGGLILLLMALFFTYISSRRISRPIQALSAAARQISMGDHSIRVHTRDSGEIGEMAAAFNEMTERQQSLITSLSQRQNELKAIMDSMIEGLLVISREGDILHYNPTAAAIFPELGSGARKYWETCRNSAVYSQIQEAFQSKGAVSGEIPLGDRYYRANTTAVESGDRLVMTFHDITEFRRLEQIKKDFIANISHEIKTPLTSIHGFVETLEEQLEGEPLRQVGIIKRNSERLINLVKDLILLSKLEETRNSDNLETIDIKALIVNLLPEYEPLAARKGLSLEHRLPLEEVKVRGDTGRLEDLLINLLDNAIKYTETGFVNLTLEADGSQAVLSVSDSGIGIAPEHLNRIFERFYVVDPSRSKQSGGTGLGLSIVKHIVALHRGSLKVESQTGKGSLFVIKLPLANSAPPVDTVP